MIWRSLICFSLGGLGLGAILSSAPTLSAATLSGTVVVRDSHSDAVNKRRDYSGVIISAEPAGEHTPGAPAGHAVMRQQGKTFSPHLLPVVTGTLVDFPNFDPIFHNAFSSYNGQVFDVGLYPPGSSRSVRFARPGVVRVFCNIHPTMSAVILVLNTRYFTETGKDGSFSLDLPAGDYDLNIFHERATESTMAALSKRVVVSAQPLSVGQIVVSEAGYLMAPHKNKYGQEYGPPPDDQTYYPASKK